jgi:hypothetical protein
VPLGRSVGKASGQPGAWNRIWADAAYDHGQAAEGARWSVSPEIASSRMGHLLDALSRAYDALGFPQATGHDEVFRQCLTGVTGTETVPGTAVFLAPDCPSRGLRVQGALRAPHAIGIRRRWTWRPLNRDRQL